MWPETQSHSEGAWFRPRIQSGTLCGLQVSQGTLISQAGGIRPGPAVRGKTLPCQSSGKGGQAGVWDSQTAQELPLAALQGNEGPTQSPIPVGDPDLRDLPSPPVCSSASRHLSRHGSGALRPREPTWEWEPGGSNQKVGWILPKSHSKSSEQGGCKDPSLLHSRLPRAPPTHPPTQESRSKALSIRRPRWWLASRTQRGPED